MGFRPLFILVCAIAALNAAAVAQALNACAAEAASSHRARIVSLAPSVTETLFEVGAGKDVVGVSESDNYPPEVRKLPKVGTFLTPNIEEIAALRPTLVIGLSSSANQRQIRALGEMGYPTLMVKEDSLADIEQSITIIGDRTGHPRRASAIVGGIKAEIADVHKLLSCVLERRVLMLVGHKPMVAVGRGTFLDELLGLAHADNIADGLSGSWPRVSMEYVIAKRPEVILDGEMGNEPSVPSDFWGQFPMIPAVRNNHIYAYPTDPTLTPGPRVADTLMMLVRMIHPEAFKSHVETARATQTPAPGIVLVSGIAR